MRSAWCNLRLASALVMISLMLQCTLSEDIQPYPLEGQILSSPHPSPTGDSGIAGVYIWSFLENDFGSGRLDSTFSGGTGGFALEKGFPNHYIASAALTCSENPDDRWTYEGMATFALMFVHPDYDTTVALFTESSGYTHQPEYWPVAFEVDTIFTGLGTDYGAEKGIHTMPDIVMRQKELP